MAIWNALVFTADSSKTVGGASPEVANTLVFQVTSVGGGATFSVEASMDGSTWATMGFVKNDGTTVTSVTAVGWYRCDISGALQARITTASGTYTTSPTVYYRVITG